MPFGWGSGPADLIRGICRRGRRALSLYAWAGGRRGLEGTMRNSVLSSKHTEEPRNGREAVGQKVYVENLWQDARQSKRKKKGLV